MKVQFTLVNGDFRVHKAGCRDIQKPGEHGDYVASTVYDSQEEAVRDLWDDIIGDYGMDPDQPSRDWLLDHGLFSATRFYPCTNGLPTDKKASTMTTQPDTTTKPEAQATPRKRGARKPDPKTGQTLGTGPNAAKSTPVATDAAKNAEAKVLSGVTTTPDKPGVRPTSPAPKPTSDVELPAEDVKQAKPEKRTAKQDLARRVVQAAGSLDGLTDEEKATISQWLHHLPTGTERGARWWAEELPRPNRSDWR